LEIAVVWFTGEQGQDQGRMMQRSYFSIQQFQMLIWQVDFVLCIIHYNVVDAAKNTVHHVIAQTS
jgi:hypothetical protein